MEDINEKIIEEQESLISQLKEMYKTSQKLNALYRLEIEDLKEKLSSKELGDKNKKDLTKLFEAFDPSQNNIKG